MSDISKIVELVINHFSELKAIDYIIIINVCFTFIALIFFFFKWLYKERLDEQSNLIKLKDEWVKTYKGLLDHKKIENDELKSNLRLLIETSREVINATHKSRHIQDIILFALINVTHQYLINYVLLLNHSIQIILLNKLELAIYNDNDEDEDYELIQFMTNTIDSKVHELLQHLPKNKEDMSKLSGYDLFSETPIDLKKEFDKLDQLINKKYVSLVDKHEKSKDTDN